MQHFASLCSTLLLCWIGAQAVLAQTTVAKPVPTDVAALERRLYLTTMNLIEREYALSHTTRVLELLRETRTSPNRGFEWGYWNALCHQEKARFSAAASHSVGGITALAWSPDGRSILSAGGGDKRVLVREATTGKITSAVPLKGGFNRAAFSPDAKRIATVGGYVVTIWRDLDRSVLARWQPPRPLQRRRCAREFLCQVLSAA